MKKKELAERLSPYAKGCFSSSLQEWIQLRKLLRDIYAFLKEDTMYCNICHQPEHGHMNLCPEWKDDVLDKFYRDVLKKAIDQIHKQYQKGH